MNLYRETPCEHGKVLSHWYFPDSDDFDGKWCPGSREINSRTRMEAALVVVDAALHTEREPVS